MLTAYRQNKERFSIFKVTSRESLLKYKREQFFCPICHESLVLKIGTKRIPHFAHRKNSSCTEQYERESDYHLSGKIKLYHWLETQRANPDLEPYIEQTRQRPDLTFMFNQSKYALEYQCSVIPEEYFVKRTESYKSVNIIPLWILGGKQINRLSTNLIKLTSFHLLFLTKKSNRTILNAYCSELNQHILFYNLIPVTSQKFITKLRFFPKDCSLQEILVPSFSKDEFLFIPIWRKELLRYKNSLLLPAGIQKSKFLTELYKCRLNLLLLPPQLGIPTHSSMFIETAPLIWQTYIYLDTLSFRNPGERFQLASVLTAFKKRIQKNEIKLRNIPEIEGSYESAIIEFINLLINFELIEYLGSHTLRMKRKIHTPDTLEEQKELENCFYLRYQKLLEKKLFF